VPSARMKLLFFPGLMPKRRTTGVGTTEYNAPESTGNFSRARSEGPRLGVR
jgi:hypothetical protein